ncbi:transmembrane protein 242 [Fopius arisanus]|uniref:Transmembrane protein 242 n=1 Tax=Fopius arisanus TaxID=64838 RepID=A0A9R1TAH6_9HYME|nr:PREDICTED: transmembrane protein 242 [Fopius arisanus]
MSGDDVFPRNDDVPHVNNHPGDLSLVKHTADSKDNKFYGVLFLGAVTGISAIIGFGTTVAAVRKKDPKYFEEGVVGVRGTTEAGVSLAMRALGWGTVYAVTGCSLIFYGIWKLSGATNAYEFRNKMGSLLPRISKKDPPQSRTEFEGLNDFLTYISEEWGKDKSGDNNK